MSHNEHWLNQGETRLEQLMHVLRWAVLQHAQAISPPLTAYLANYSAALTLPGCCCLTLCTGEPSSALLPG
jgi:hypothetical protein